MKQSSSNAVALFGREGATFLEIVGPVVQYLASDPVRYTIVDPQTFRALLHSDTSRATSVYWQEMLGRAHFAAAASMIRSYRWCRGMLTAYASNLFLPYCASFRGLLESVADTHDGIRNVPTALAENHAAINAALRMKSSVPLLAKELEESLIHFAFARKLEKGAAAPTSHRAKTAADYVKGLSTLGSPEHQALYGELCQLTHPAAHSVHYLLLPEGEDTSSLIGQHEELRIQAFAERYVGVFPNLLMLGFNSAFLTLKVLRHLDAPAFHATIVDKFDASGISAWKRIEASLSRG